MKKLWTLALVFGAAFVLAACTVTVLPPVDPFPNALPVTANDDPFTSLVSSSVAPGGSVVYNVTIPSAVIAGADVVFFELNTSALALVVYNAAGNDLASSASSDGFVQGDGAASALSAAAISADIACRGSCVILPASAGTNYVEVVNNGGSSESFALFVFGDDEQDEGEPANDATATAPSLSESIDQEGAIETLGDVDLFSVETSGTLLFESTSPLDLVAQVLLNGAVQATLAPGETAQVFAGDIVRVQENGGNAAGPSSKSKYDLSITASDPFPGAEQVSAGTNPDSPVDSDSVAGSASKVYEVSVSGGAAASDLLYLELDTEDADLVVYSSSGSALASSTSASGFSAGGAPSSQFDTSGITVQVACRGSCVLLEASNASYFVEVINRTGTTLAFELFAFGDPYQDSNEPDNDSVSGAPNLGSGDSGAIETLGDDDWFLVNTGGSLLFSTTSGLDLRAAVTAFDGSPIASLSTGQSTTVIAGDRVRVYELNGDAAGPAGSSGYSLAIE